MAADHFRHAFRAAGASGIGDSGWGIVFLGAGIYFLPSVQPDSRCVRICRLADDAGWRHKWRYRAGDRPVPENTLDYIGSERYWLSRGLWIVDWLLGIYLFAGACPYAE